MCGIVSFFGQADGVTRVIEALRLLEYRAPDSAGLAALAGSDGHMAVCRSVGPTRHLVAALAAQPLYGLEVPNGRPIADLLARQGLDPEPELLRDCSPAAGYTFHHLYDSSGLHIGLGDRGGTGGLDPSHRKERFSDQLYQSLKAVGGLSSPDYDPDAVRHAFRLIAAHVASRAAVDIEWRDALDEALLKRVPGGAYGAWQDAWSEELTANLPGHAFAVAVRHFQQTFPGLAEHLAEEDWERVGGMTARAMAQIVLGHGRWAMVGAVTETNAHPLLDRSRTRAVCENGSHNASLVLRVQAEQEAWWRAHGVPESEPVHRSQNTTEIIAYEWERSAHRLQSEELDQEEKEFRDQLDAWCIDDPEEQALRLALWRLRAGNTHACVFLSRRSPGVLHVSSHRKPVAIAIRTIESDDGAPPRRELMVASDVNAALMLWAGAEVNAAAERIEALQRRIDQGGRGKNKAKQELKKLLDHFTVEVIFLDASLYRGRQLLVRISNKVEAGQIHPDIQVSRYDGTPFAVTSQQMRLNPAMVGRRDYATYTESHIAEIPEIMDGLMRAYGRKGQVHLNSIWKEGVLVWPGLNTGRLRQHFGSRLKRLKRVLLIGEGSSWRDAQAAAPLFRELLPEGVVIVYQPVVLLNLGQTVDPTCDLAVEISWSGTTDSLLKVDNLLAELGVMRLAITGRPQSDLGRRAANSAGTLDVRSGVEISVATVKGFAAILATLNLLALQLARLCGGTLPAEKVPPLTDELILVVPRHIRTVIEDQERRQKIRQIAERCRDFNKVAIVGSSPINLEGELKIEELAQVVTNTFEFHSASLRPLIEHSAIVAEDRHRTLVIINATTSDQQREAWAVINYLNALQVFFIIHTTPNADLKLWQAIPNAEVIISPYVSDLLQPLIDAPFFFDFAVGLAYARGLQPEEIDRPRNLAKSVTTTAIQSRDEAESQPQFKNVTLADFDIGQLAQTAWDSIRGQPSQLALRATVALRAALAVISEQLPERLALTAEDKHLIVVADTESTENAAQMAAAAWQRLLGMDVTVYRRFFSELPEPIRDTALLRFIRAGAILSVRDSHTIALPADYSPLQLELLGSVYLIGLAVRLARQRGADTVLWEAGLAQLPLLIAQVLTDPGFSQQVEAALAPYLAAGYDKVQVIGGGQDFASARSIARCIRMRGFMTEALYTDSAWHGPLATVGGPDADHDALIIILATDPLFQAAALVDTQVYRTRNAHVIMIVPEGNQTSPIVRGVDPSVVLAVPAVPRPFVPAINIALGDVIARQMARLWEETRGAPP